MRTAPILACALFTALSCATAAAHGTAQVSQSDGSVQTYANVRIRVVDQMLKITTSDGKGTLVISKAACSFVGDLQRCLPYSLTLHQGGKDLALAFDSGFAYFNQTARALHLPHSSVSVPPRGMVLFMRTKIGTRLSVTGTVDEVKTS